MEATICFSKPKVRKPKSMAKAPSRDDEINEQRTDQAMKGRQSGGRVATILASGEEDRKARSPRAARIKTGS